MSGELSELVAEPGVGRVRREAVRTGIDEATATGRIRLDAIARWLQDAAYWDLVDAGWHKPAPWFVRRLRLRVERFPVFAEPLSLSTWCSGLGGAVAERRTAIVGEEGARVEAVALWVHLDPESLRPLTLDAKFLAAFAPSAAGRRSRTRLRHSGAVPEGAAARPFLFRASDVDPAAHVNNAAYWAALEEELTQRTPEDGLDVEVEHRAPSLPGPATVRSVEGRRWVVDPAAGTVATFVFG